MAPILFVHIMRTGGTSLRQLLWRVVPSHRTYPNDVDLERFGGYPGIAAAAAHVAENPLHYDLVNGHYPFVFRDVLPAGAHVISMLREPVARSVSILKWAKRRYEPLAGKSLEEIFDDETVREGMLRDYQTKVFSLRHVHEIHGINQPLAMEAWRLELAKANVADSAAVGITEAFAESAVVIGRRLGLELGPPPRINTTDDVASDVSNVLVSRIRSAVEMDLELYDFARALLSDD